MIKEKHGLDSTLSIQDKIDVMDIAKLCPYYDGIAVYLARDLLLKMGYTVPTNDCERVIPLSQKFRRLKASTTKVKPFQLFPNPTKGDFTISYDVKDVDNVRIEIYNAIGIKLIERELVEGNEHQIDKFSSEVGFYVYRIFSNNKQIRVGKLILQ